MIQGYENILPDETYEVLEKGRRLPVGTLRTWGNTTYVKVGEKKWLPQENLKMRLSTEDRFFDEKSNSWSSERKSLHESIIKKHTEGAKKSNDPTVILMMGAPGSGKGTIRRYLDKEGLTSPSLISVDPDEIKTKDLGEDFNKYRQFNTVSASGKVHEEGSYLAKEIISKLSEVKSDFLIDKVFSNEGKLRKQISSLQKKGYKVKLIMASLPKEIGFKRALERGRRTGRYINKESASHSYDVIDSTFAGILNDPPKGLIEITQYDTNVKQGEDPKLKVNKKL